MPASVAQLLQRVMAIFRWMPVPHVSSRPRNGSALSATPSKASGYAPNVRMRVNPTMAIPAERCRTHVVIPEQVGGVRTRRRG